MELMVCQISFDVLMFVPPNKKLRVNENRFL